MGSADGQFLGGGDSNGHGQMLPPFSNASMSTPSPLHSPSPSLPIRTTGGIQRRVGGAQEGRVRASSAAHSARAPPPSVDLRSLRADTLRSEMLERAQSDFTMQSEDFPALPGFRAAQARLLLPAWDSPHVCVGTRPTSALGLCARWPTYAPDV